MMNKAVTCGCNEVVVISCFRGDEITAFSLKNISLYVYAKLGNQRSAAHVQLNAIVESKSNVEDSF